ncbi:extracellular solute-binding protein [Nonomuraea sp. NPDC052129]|uniref:ABC transporter substrate-binding protein n=1 Tax=Nonomuraea sp. NPDC052129 TaxID=3154651 RepID=UPI0034416C91
MSDLSRRGFLQVGVAAAGALALAGCAGGGGGSGGAASMQFAWWGSTARHNATQQALAAFRKKRPGVQVRTQFSGWDGYWEKLATQTAGGNAPDVIQMDYSYIGEYARRGSLLDLGPYLGKGLDLSGFAKDVVDAGKIGGKQYGVNFGINSMALIWNRTLAKEIGVEVPETFTWPEFGELSKKIAEKAPKGVYASEDGAQDGGAFENWLLERGKMFFTADGKLAYDEKDLTEWFTFWDGLRKAGAAAPPDVQATAAGDVQNSLVATRKAVMDWAWSNQLTAYMSVTKDDIAVHAFPTGDKPGQYYKPSMLLTVSAATKRPQDAVALVNALVSDVDVATPLGSERGVPPSSAIRAALEPKASPSEKLVYAYIESLSDKVGPLPPPQPLGAGELHNKVLMNINQQVGFGKLSIAEGVSRFFDEARRVLK